MTNLVTRLLVCLTALALCGVSAPAPASAKEKGRSNLQSGSKIITVKQPKRIDPEGYRLVSTDSKLRCMETLRSTLDCKE